MKRMLSLVLVLALLPVGLAFSQKGFAELGFAYGFGAGTTFITTTGTATNVSGVYGSFGEGIRFGASGGYMFNKNFGAQFGFVYLVGKSFDGDGIGQNNAKQKWSGSGFLFVPGFIVSTGMDKIEPYARLGIVLGFLKTTAEQNTANSEYSQTESGGISLGLLGGVGAAFNITHMFSVYGEITILTITQNPSTREITKSTVGGQTQPDQGKKYDLKDGYDPTNAAANTRLGVRQPYSSAGITIGGRVYF